MCGAPVSTGTESAEDGRASAPRDGERGGRREGGERERGKERERGGVGGRGGAGLRGNASP